MASKVTKEELHQALVEVTKEEDCQLSLLSQQHYDATINVWVDAFQKDPMILWLVGLGTELNADQQVLVDNFSRIFLQWPARPIAVREKGFVLGAKSNATGDDETMVGAMSLLPSSQKLMGFWDIVTNLIYVGALPTQSGATKSSYGPYAEQRFGAFASTLDKKKNEIMSGERSRYIYVQTLGVLTSCHGQGWGGKFLRALHKVADSLQAYVYLETESAQNEAFYQHFSFHTAETVDLCAKGDTSPDATLRMYLMVRNPDGVVPDKVDD